MLINLHVKNLALIEEEEISFSGGLNILTGETGAGKSILLGALSLALGGRFVQDFIRDPNKDALAEAVFSLTPQQEEALLKMEIPVFDHEVILTRRILGGRSTSRINGETVPTQKLAAAGELLIDIYGQKEHLSLLKPARHLQLLDEYAADLLKEPKAELSDAFRRYRSLLKELSEAQTDASERRRRLDFLTHEAAEIRAAELTEGEDEQLEEEYRRLSHGQKILTAAGEAYQAIGEAGGASESMGRATRVLSSAAEYDEKAAELYQQAQELDSLTGDLSLALSDYLSSFDFSEEKYLSVQQRLDTINGLKSKYGRTIREILDAADQKEAEVEKLSDYDVYLSDLKADLNEMAAKLDQICTRVTDIRKKAAEELCRRVSDALSDLNFEQVVFTMKFSKTTDYTEGGRDLAEFYISTNPGEPVRPLAKIASGGEMSRIMLAMKTVLADRDDIDTMIFDEIDAGISGRTAQAVSERLSDVAAARQVICITHLPQIAAMADAHYLIEKTVQNKATVSSIRRLDEEGSVSELARMLGGSAITPAVLSNARELKTFAEHHKSTAEDRRSQGGME